MGDQMMHRGWTWRCVALMARALESAEQEVVAGDLAESRATAWAAFTEVTGLVVRRQSGLWADWRPWCMLIGVTLPLGLLFSVVSRSWVDAVALSGWGYVNYWSERGARPTIVEEMTALSISVLAAYVALIGWAWTVGFAIRSLSTRTAWAHVAIFALVVAAGEEWGTTTLVKMVVVAMAVWYGLLRAQRASTFGGRLIAIGLVLLTVATWESARALCSSLFPVLDGGLESAGEPLAVAARLMPFVVMWPAVYVAVCAARTSHPRAVPSAEGRA